jgi:hypothetical protein
MKTRLNSMPHQRGFTYVTVVVTMVVVGLMLAAYLKLVAVQNQLTMRSQVWNRSVPVLEAGIEEALAHLNKNASPDSSGTFNPQMTADNWIADADGGWHKLGSLDGDFYYVKIAPWPVSGTGPTNFPHLYSTGYVQQVSAFALNRVTGPFIASSLLDQLVAQGKYSRRVVEATTTNVPTFTKGLVSKKGINMNGNNVKVDSYDSQIGGRNINGRWHSSIARDKGDVASNDTITNTINVGNANIWGRVATGPFGTISLGPNGSVGDVAWQTGGNRGIKPGWSTDDMNVEFPDVVMPSVAWSAMPAGGGGYNYVFNQSGDYRLPSGTLSGKVLVTAPNVRLRIDGGLSFTGQGGLTITSNANIKIYLNCASAQVTGQGVINQGTPAQCYIFGTSTLKDLDIGGNGEATCVVYAPYASVKLHGGGNSEEDFSGALVANNFTFTGHYNVHYDESLGRMGLWRGFVLTSWNEK